MFYQSRREIMRSIRSRGNKRTELVMAKILKVAGIKGWRRHVSISLGPSGRPCTRKHFKARPDFVFAVKRVVLFVDGCFWHDCKQHGRGHRVLTDYWRAKLNANKLRDRRNARLLRRSGWRVIRVWEHALSSPEPIVSLLRQALNSSRSRKRVQPTS